MKREKNTVSLSWLLGKLNSPYAEYVIEQFKDNSDIVIESPADRAFSEKETKILAQFSDALQEKGCTCKFDAGYTISQAIEASRRLNSWVEEIKNAKVDGRALTNFEKYIYAYEIVTDFVYNEEKEGEDWRTSRGLVQILTGDKICCGGYAALLNNILGKLEMPTAYVHLTSKNGGMGHSACAVFVQDEKYGMENIVFSDPTFGARSKTSPKDFQYSIMQKKVAENVWKGLKMELKEVQSYMENSIYDVYRNKVDKPDECRKALEKSKQLFKSNMANNQFDELKFIGAAVKVFRAQGLSEDAASVMASARFWGQTVGQIVENQKNCGTLNISTETELLEFAKNKKDYSKRDSKARTSRKNKTKNIA